MHVISADNYRPSVSISGSDPQCLTIPYSHFCELGIWSLQAASLRFDQHAFAPGLHVLPVLSSRVSPKQRHFGKGSAVTAVEAVGDGCGKKPYKPHFATAVPLCLMPDGRVLVDSWDILRESARSTGIRSPSAQLEALLDHEIGPLVRQALYEIVFRPANRSAWDGLVTQDCGAAWRVAWRLGVGRQLTASMAKLFRTDDAQAVDLGRRRLHDALDRLEQEHLRPALEAHGDGFLGGSKPDFTDVAIAALVGPLALPPLYARGSYSTWFDMLMDQDASARSEVESFRLTPLGQHCMKVYEACRVTPLRHDA